MRKSIANLLTFSLLALSLIVPCAGQRAAQQFERQSFPIAYGSRNDGFPRKLKARGTISQVNYAPPRCGELIFAATFEIKLDGKLSGYRYPFLYLVVPCLYKPDGPEEFLNQRIEISATKQDGKRRPCFFDIETNSINSKGVPFYCAEREELLKSITSGTNSAATEPIEFDGRLEEGITYRAFVICDQEQELKTIVPLRIPFHHAARIEWLNLREFPQLDKAKNARCRQQIVFKVIKRETIKVAGQNRWNTTYRCRILAIEK